MSGSAAAMAGTPSVGTPIDSTVSKAGYNGLRIYDSCRFAVSFAVAFPCVARMWSNGGRKPCLVSRMVQQMPCRSSGDVARLTVEA